MSWQTIALADAPPSPWKNGGGLTRELVAWPNAQDWAWRMSVAEVALSGPFSHFAGVQRWFAVLSGAGVRVDMGQPPDVTVHTLTDTSAPLCFEGELPVQCTLLDGPTQDFNLMLRRDHTGGRMLRLDGDHSEKFETSKTIALYSINTRAAVQFNDETATIPPKTLVWRNCPAGTRLVLKTTSALWMEIDA
jgi:environmental stress-induced protein Ves